MLWPRYHLLADLVSPLIGLYPSHTKLVLDYVFPPGAVAQIEKKFRVRAALQDTQTKLEALIANYLCLAAKYHSSKFSHFLSKLI